MVSLSQYLEASDILTEDAKDKTRAKKIMQDLSKIEGRFRNKMYKLDEVLNKDMENKNLSKSLRMSYFYLMKHTAKPYTLRVAALCIRETINIV